MFLTQSPSTTKQFRMPSLSGQRCQAKSLMPLINASNRAALRPRDRLLKSFSNSLSLLLQHLPATLASRHPAALIALHQTLQTRAPLMYPRGHRWLRVHTLQRLGNRAAALLHRLWPLNDPKQTLSASPLEKTSASSSQFLPKPGCRSHRLLLFDKRYAAIFQA